MYWLALAASHQLSMPAAFHDSLESLAPFARRGDSRIEDRCVSGDVPIMGEGEKFVSRGAADRPMTIPKVYQAAVDQGRAELCLQRLQGAEHSIDGASGRVRVRLVDADGQEPFVAPVTCTGERMTVRLPLRQVLVDRGEELV